MTNEIQDERYCIVNDAIFDSFLLVLKNKDIDKITVTDIIKKAGIVRSTFYNHYENIPALICAIEDKTLDDIFSIMETFHPKNDHELCKSFFMTICNYTMTNPFLSNLLKNPRGDTFFEKAITMLHHYVSTITENRTPTNHNKEEFSYMVACAIGSSIGVLHKWSKEQFHTPVEVIADILTQAFMSGVLPQMS
jgi:AcrR family transcriptional regulator